MTWSANPLWLALLVGFVLGGGCSFDPLQQVEELTVEHNYAAALEILDGMDSVEAGNPSWHRLRTEVLLVQGRQDEAFVQLAASRPEPGFVAEDWAKTLLKAAKVILREKDRAAEAVTILDSCIALSEGMRQPAANLAWQRAMEYFNVPGLAAYELIRFASRHDDQIMGRLKAFNIFFFTRYTDMRDVEQLLRKWEDGIGSFYRVYRRPPHSFMELLPYTNTAVSDTSREGWEFEFTGSTARPRILAKVTMDHSKGIPWGTTMTAL